MRKLRRAVHEAKTRGVDLSEWEQEFAETLEERLETFGSAFADPAKGSLEEPLTPLQARKVAELAKKARQSDDSREKPRKARKPLKARKPMSARSSKYRLNATNDGDE